MPPENTTPDTAWSATEIVKIKVSDLAPYARNSKTHPEAQVDQIVASIKQWGWTVPILVDEKGMVLAGHARLAAATKMGMAEVPCVVAAGWSDDQKRAYVIADNKLAERGEWDMGIYLSELKFLDTAKFDLSFMGVDEDLSFLNYDPNLAPSTALTDTSDEDMDNASGNIQSGIDGISGDKSKKGTEVMCPNCAHSFVFSGV